MLFGAQSIGFDMKLNFAVALESASETRKTNKAKEASASLFLFWREVRHLHFHSAIGGERQLQNEIVISSGNILNEPT